MQPHQKAPRTQSCDAVGREHYPTVRESASGGQAIVCLNCGRIITPAEARALLERHKTQRAQALLDLQRADAVTTINPLDHSEDLARDEQED
jgi:hypothetical protein